jgi:hypothetical protein
MWLFCNGAYGRTVFMVIFKPVCSPLFSLLPLAAVIYLR